MNSGQMILVVCAMIILGILSLNIYKSSGSRNDNVRYNEAVITATGLAQSIINEIGSKAFDENTVSKAATSRDSLTLAGLLGKDSGEFVKEQFDDIDDYNNYTTYDTLSRLGIFTVHVDVYYITNMYPDYKSYLATFAKQVDVRITNFSLPDTLKFSQVITY